MTTVSTSSLPPIIRRPELVAAVGLSRATIDRLERAGNFPRRFAITPGGRAVGWPGAEVARWIERRVAARAGQ